MPKEQRPNSRNLLRSRRHNPLGLGLKKSKRYPYPSIEMSNYGKHFNNNNSKNIIYLENSNIHEYKLNYINGKVCKNNKKLKKGKYIFVMNNT